MTEPRYIEETFSLLPPALVSKNRAIGRNISQCFRRAVRCQDSWNFEVHHIIPLHLGGSIGWSNLAMVDHDLHVEIHKYINRQTHGMKPYEKRHIIIPIYNGRLWGESFQTHTGLRRHN